VLSATLEKTELRAGMSAEDLVGAFKAASTVAGNQLLYALTVDDLKAFDANGDNKFSEAETAAAAAAVGLEGTVTVAEPLSAAGSSASSIASSVIATAAATAAAAFFL